MEKDFDAALAAARNVVRKKLCFFKQLFWLACAVIMLFILDGFMEGPIHLAGWLLLAWGLVLAVYGLFVFICHSVSPGQKSGSHGKTSDKG